MILTSLRSCCCIMLAVFAAEPRAETSAPGPAAPVLPVFAANEGAGSRLINLSILTRLDGGGDSFTLGYVVGGAGTSGAKPLVIRAAGPSLGALGVAGTLRDPKLELFAGSTKTGENDDWGGSSALAAAIGRVGAFPYSGPLSLDAAVATTSSSRDNSVRISAVDRGAGAVIAEIYDATPDGSAVATTPRLVNVSVFKHLGTGVTAGFVIGGSTTSKSVLIRAVGPTLGRAPFNIGGVVADPTLTLFGPGGVRIAANDDWGGTPELTAAFAAVGAFALPAGSLDAALFATLPPGSYTVRAAGVGTTTGSALIEIYELPDAMSTAVLRGVVRNAVTGNDINGATLVFSDASGASLGTVRTALFGEYALNPPPGRLTATVSAPGYLTTSLSVTAVANAALQIPTIYLSPNPTGTGTISGRIVDALTGRGLPGATLSFRSGVGFTTGTILGTITTNSAGDYTVSAAAGNYTVEISIPNFVIGYIDTVCVAGRTRFNQNAAITPFLPDNETRFVLTWGSAPADLDTYLFDENGVRLVWYEKRTIPGANLDVDDRDSFGPETLTISRLAPGTYYYGVWNYSNGGEISSNRLSNLSDAVVRVFKGSTQIARLDVPTGRSGNLWTVFEIDGATGRVTPINTVSQELGGGTKFPFGDPGSRIRAGQIK